MMSLVNVTLSCLQMLLQGLALFPVGSVPEPRRLGPYSSSEKDGRVESEQETNLAKPRNISSLVLYRCLPTSAQLLSLKHGFKQ